MTPAQLRRKAHAARLKASELSTLARLWERAADEMAQRELPRLLQSPGRQRKVFSAHMNMSPEVKAKKNLAISKKTKSDDPLVKACQARGISLRALAAELGMSPGSLIGYRQGKRPIGGATADAIAARVGFAATKTNWPAGVDR